ncbi:cation/H+ exchanger, CPA1 family protein, partial [Tanacetum coccineum]
NQNCLVRDRIVNGLWAWDWRRPVNGGRALADLNNLLMDIGSLNVEVDRDCVVSSLSTDGSYSVSFIRKHIDNCMIANSLPSTRWCKIIPRKVNIFMWRLLLDRLPHRLNLSSRGLDIDSILCPVCSEHVESNSHAFFSCSAASNIWRLVRGWCELKIPTLSSCDEWDIWYTSWKASKVEKDRAYVIFAATLSSGPGGRTKKIFVGGLASTVTESDFKKYFDQFGGITDVVVMYDHNTKRPRGFGFITFDSEETMEQIPCGPVCDQFPLLTARYPWLISQNLEDDNQDQYFYTIHDELPHYQCRIPELLGKLIQGCFHGWMVLSNHPQNNEWSLWNQVTSKIISLPTLNLEYENYESIGQCCLAAPPDDPSSVLLLAKTNESTFVYCHLGSKRKKFRWTEMSYAKQLKRLSFTAELLRNLTYCNDKIYALSTDGASTSLVIQVDIMVVKQKEVVITLMLFGECPPHPSYPSYRCWCGGDIKFYLKGSCAELYYIIYYENKSMNTPADVYLYKLDMTSIKWEEMDDLKDANLFLDLSRDQSVSYSRVIASELGGYIHIRGKMGKTIYSYHVKDKTVSLFSIPSPILPTSHMSIWECRLEDDHEKAKCTLDSKVGAENKCEILLRSDTNDRVEYNESHLLNIPFNLLETIMEHCAGVEYMKFRATCRQCHLAAPVIKWSNKTSLWRLQTYSVASPWLMVVDKNRDVITFKDPMLGDNYLMKKSQISIASDKILSSRFGWLLFESNDLSCLVLFNPFTNDLRKLPQSEYDLESLNFSAPPTSADCIVVGIARRRWNWHVHIHFVNREPTWLKVFHNSIPPTICFSSFYGRDLYALCEDGKVIVFNNLGNRSPDCCGNRNSYKSFYGNCYKIVVAEAPESVCGSLTQKFLTKCEQHLLLVCVSEYGKHVQVNKLNKGKKEWEKITGIGKHMIYICDTTCLCLEAKTPQMENKIFFPQVYSKNRKIVFYSLDTCMYHTFDGKNIQQVDLFGTTSYLSSHAWIEPSWL